MSTERDIPAISYDSVNEYRNMDISDMSRIHMDPPVTFDWKREVLNNKLTGRMFRARTDLN